MVERIIPKEGIQLTIEFPGPKQLEIPFERKSQHIPPYKLLKNFTPKEREEILKNSMEDREERNQMYRR